MGPAIMLRCNLKGKSRLVQQVPFGLHLYNELQNIILDKDECTKNQDQCDRGSTECVNKVPHEDGEKYICECLEGFDRYGDLICTGESGFHFR